jgi:heat-inducible transcriptional repressor
MELDNRKQRILQAIVDDYVATAEPVGSHVLVSRYSLGVKSATIRNEMAEMSERGFLRQPHTSAGRVPSDRGYRFYVNRLMPLPVIQPGEADAMRSAVASASSELDAILRRTCSLLAAMTRLPAVATPPDADDTELRQVFVSPVGVDKALLVLLFSTGRTENRLVGVRLTASDALLLANALNEWLGGQTLSALRQLPPDGDAAGAATAPPELRHLAAAWNRLAGEAVAAARAVGDDLPMVVEGAHAVLEHPEFRDVERLGQFLTTLQERAAVLEMMGRALEERRQIGKSSSVQVVIGEEIGRPQLQEYSVVSSTYFVGDRERGRIGVLGPTRMDYGRAVGAVELMARVVGDLLTRLSVER